MLLVIFEFVFFISFFILLFNVMKTSKLGEMNRQIWIVKKMASNPLWIYGIRWKILFIDYCASEYWDETNDMSTVTSILCSCNPKKTPNLSTTDVRNALFTLYILLSIFCKAKKHNNHISIQVRENLLFFGICSVKRPLEMQLPSYWPVH